MRSEKVRIFALYQILKKYTDDTHGITINEMLTCLDKDYSIKTTRHTVEKISVEGKIIPRFFHVLHRKKLLAAQDIFFNEEYYKLYRAYSVVSLVIFSIL